jgi:hypothetical protein
LKTLALKGKAAGCWTTKQAMLDHISRVVDQRVTLANIGELSDALLALVEHDIAASATF